jgi:hypothetical protein
MIADLLYSQKPQGILVEEIWPRCQRKFYINVHVAWSLWPQKHVKDDILNFAWQQFCDQNFKHVNNLFKVATFTSFFFTKLLEEGHTDDYCYHNVSKWGQRILGQVSPMDFDAHLVSS